MQPQVADGEREHPNAQGEIRAEGAHAAAFRQSSMTTAIWAATLRRFAAASAFSCAFVSSVIRVSTVTSLTTEVCFVPVMYRHYTGTTQERKREERKIP